MWEALARLRDAFFGVLNGLVSRPSDAPTLVDGPSTLAELTSSQRLRPLVLERSSRPVTYWPPPPFVQAETEGDKTIPYERSLREIQREA